MVKTVVAAVGKVDIWLAMRYQRREMTKDTLEKPTGAIRTIDSGNSRLGESGREAEGAETKRIPISRPRTGGSYE